MRKAYLLAGAGAVVLAAVPADAALLKWDFWADLTYVEDSQETGYHSEYFGPSGTKTIQGELGALLDMPTDASPVQPACAACISYAVVGSSVVFDIDPAFVPSYGYATFRFTFDRDLGGDIGAASGAAFVSGYFETIAAGGSAYRGYEGPILGLVTAGAVPEPMSWALFIAGFAAVGAGLRASRRQVRLERARL